MWTLIIFEQKNTHTITENATREGKERWKKSIQQPKQFKMNNSVRTLNKEAFSVQYSITFLFKRSILWLNLILFDEKCQRQVFLVACILLLIFSSRILFRHETIYPKYSRKNIDVKWLTFDDAMKYPFSSEWPIEKGRLLHSTVFLQFFSSFLKYWIEVFFIWFLRC